MAYAASRVLHLLLPPFAHLLEEGAAFICSHLVHFGGLVRGQPLHHAPRAVLRLGR